MKRILMTALLMAAPAAAAQTITGAGASFPNPLYTKMFAEYAKLGGVQVNYQSVGSGAGQRQILAQTVDFGGTDAPLTNEQLASAPGGNRILHVPTALGSVVPTYNVPGVTTKLRFDGPLLADIYLGKVRSWNDARLVPLNPGVTLPNLPITVVRRSDGSGTTAIFVDYLAKVSPEWAERVSKGPQTSVNWPVGIGAPQNAGVAGQVRNTPGGIGYVEVAYARQNKLGYGLVRNAAGRFVDGGDLKTVSAAAGGAPLPADARVSITNTRAANGYPISGFTWVMVYRQQQYGNRTRAQAKAVADLLWWMTHEGQQYNEDLDYGRLPEVAQARAEALIRSIRFGDTALRN